MKIYDAVKTEDAAREILISHGAKNFEFTVARCECGNDDAFESDVFVKGGII